MYEVIFHLTLSLLIGAWHGFNVNLVNVYEMHSNSPDIFYLVLQKVFQQSLLPLLPLL
jgi:hypothetical protein